MAFQWPLTSAFGLLQVFLTSLFYLKADGLSELGGINHQVVSELMARLLTTSILEQTVVEILLSRSCWL